MRARQGPLQCAGASHSCSTGLGLPEPTRDVHDRVSWLNSSSHGPWVLIERKSLLTVGGTGPDASDAACNLSGVFFHCDTRNYNRRDTEKLTLAGRMSIAQRVQHRESGGGADRGRSRVCERLPSWRGCPRDPLSASEKVEWSIRDRSRQGIPHRSLWRMCAISLARLRAFHGANGPGLRSPWAMGSLLSDV